MKRGLGSPNYNRERAREVQRAGNRALRSQNKQHRWTQEEAIDAGRKGAARMLANKKRQTQDTV